MTTTRSQPPVTKRADAFSVQTRIGRAVGEASRYACDAVRALPAKRGQVILQATDGHQATCVLTSGTMRQPRLVPTSVLPTRRTQSEAQVRLVDGQWQSTEGKLADDASEGANFPPVADVLPVVGERPFYETAAQAERRRAAAMSSARAKGGEAPESMHVMVGIDAAKLAKLADGLGTSKLTLFVPVPVRRRSDRNSPEQTCVNGAIAVCPAERVDDKAQTVNGVGVIMPIRLERTPADYARVRHLVIEAEKRATTKRRAG